MRSLLAVLLALFLVGPVAAGETRFSGSVGGWHFRSEVLSTDDGDSSGGGLCTMSMQTRQGGGFGLFWIATDAGITRFGFWHEEIERSTPVLRFGSGFTHHVRDKTTSGPTDYLAVVDESMPATYASAIARKFYRDFAQATEIETTDWIYTLGGTMRALNSRAFNECMSDVFLPGELAYFGVHDARPASVQPAQPPSSGVAPEPAAPPAPQAGYVLNEADGRLFFSGDITEGFALAVAAKLAQYRPQELVIMSSAGGLVDEAITAAELLRGWEVDTVLLGDCASSCVTLFASGAQRDTSPGARLGIHQSWTDSGDVDIAGFQTSVARLFDLYDKAGIDPKLLRDAMTVDSDTVRWLTPDEARAYNLVNAP